MLPMFLSFILVVSKSKHKSPYTSLPEISSRAIICCQSIALPLSDDAMTGLISFKGVTVQNLSFLHERVFIFCFCFVMFLIAVLTWWLVTSADFWPDSIPFILYLLINRREDEIFSDIILENNASYSWCRIWSASDSTLCLSSLFNASTSCDSLNSICDAIALYIYMSEFTTVFLYALCWEKSSWRKWSIMVRNPWNCR